MSLSSVSWVFVILYIQYKWGSNPRVLTKKHRCRKNRTCTRDLWFNTNSLTKKWGNFYPLNGLSLFVSVDLGFSGHKPAAEDVCCKQRTWDLWEKENKTKQKSLALRFCYSGSFIDSANIRQIHEWRSCCRGRQTIGRVRSLRLDGRHGSKTGTTRGEDSSSSSSSPSLSYHAFWKKKNGQQTLTTIQPCTHWPRKEREMAGQRRVRLSDTLGLSREQTI